MDIYYLLINNNCYNIIVFVFSNVFQNLEVKMSSMCEEDKAQCECIISETNVNIFFFYYYIYSNHCKM